MRLILRLILGGCKLRVFVPACIFEVTCPPAMDAKQGGALAVGLVVIALAAWTLVGRRVRADHCI